MDFYRINIITMETPLNSPEHTKKDDAQDHSERGNPGKATFGHSLGNIPLIANRRAEPNFNLNLHLTSSSNPRTSSNGRRLSGGCAPSGNRRDDGNKAQDPNHGFKPSRLPNAHRGEQRLKSPNAKCTTSLSPRAHTLTHSSTAASPQRHAQSPCGYTSTVTSRMQANRKKNAAEGNVSTLAPEKRLPRSLNTPVSPGILGFPGTSRPKPSNSTTIFRKPSVEGADSTSHTSKKPDIESKSSEHFSQRSKELGSEERLLDQKPESHRTGSTVDRGGSHEMLSKDKYFLDSCSDLKNSSNSGPPGVSKAKISLSERKTGFTPDTGPASQHGPVTSDMKPGSSTETGTVECTSNSNTSLMGSGWKTTVTGSLSTSSLPHPGLVGPKCEPKLSPDLTISGSMDSSSPSALARPTSGGDPIPYPRVGSDSPKSTESISRPVLVDLSFYQNPSSQHGSSTTALDCRPVSSVGTGPSGHSRLIQRSPSSVRGSTPVLTDSSVPLATSSPKTRLSMTVMSGGSIAVETPSDSATHNIHNLIGGLAFDSVTKPIEKSGSVVKDDILKLTQSKMATLCAPRVSQVPAQADVCYQGNGMSTGSRGHPGTQLSDPCCLGDTNATMKTSLAGSRKVGPLHPLPPVSICQGGSRSSREAATIKDPSERLCQRGAQHREVGVQVEVELVERSASTSPSLLRELTSSLLCSPSYVPISPPPFQHVCKIDIEMRGQAALPSAAADKARSLPACLRAFRFEQGVGLSAAEKNTREMSSGSIWEDEERGGWKEEKERGEGQTEREETGAGSDGTRKEGPAGRRKGAEATEADKEAEREKTEKPQSVQWDARGMTWEVYGASLDLESLGTAIQSHIQSRQHKQGEKEEPQRSSVSSTNGKHRGKKGRRRRKKGGGGILGCCRKAPAVAE